MTELHLISNTTARLMHPIIKQGVLVYPTCSGVSEHLAIFKQTQTACLAEAGFQGQGQKMYERCSHLQALDLKSYPYLPSFRRSLTDGRREKEV